MRRAGRRPRREHRNAARLGKGGGASTAINPSPKRCAHAQSQAASKRRRSEPTTLARGGGGRSTNSPSDCTQAAERSGRLPAGGPTPPLLASYAGCLLTRRFAAAAFAKHRRSMTAPDLIDAIGAVFEDFSPASPGEPVNEYGATCGGVKIPTFAQFYKSKCMGNSSNRE